MLGFIPKLGVNWLLLGIAIVASGCNSTPEFVAEPVALVGQVDTSLPKDAQQKQHAVYRFLNAMQEGVGDAGQLQLLAPGIQYTLPFDNFLAGSKRLARWSFDGPPEGTQVAVKLSFDDELGGPIKLDKLKQERRVYTVSISGNQAKISAGK